MVQGHPKLSTEDQSPPTCVQPGWQDDNYEENVEPVSGPPLKALGNPAATGPLIGHPKANVEDQEQPRVKFVDLPGFKIQALMAAVESPWAPQPDLDDLDTEEAVASRGLCGEEYPDSTTSREILTSIPARSTGDDDPVATSNSQKRSQGSGTSSKKRLKEILQVNFHMPFIGRHRRAEEKRRRLVLNGTRQPFDSQVDGRSAAGLRLKHIKQAITIDSSHFSTRIDAKRSKSGFIGLRDKGSAEPAANPRTTASETSIPIEPWMDPLLKKLLKAGYRYIASNINVDMPIRDADDTIVGVIAGVPTGLRPHRQDVAKAVQILADSLGKHSEAGGRRGKFQCAEYGVSFGGGQKVPMQFAKNKHPAVAGAWKEWNENPAVQAFSYHASEVFKTYQPTEYSAAEKVTQRLQGQNPDLWPNGPAPIWPWHSQTVNQRSATTVAFNHRDINNGTFCAVQAGGNFDYRRGGQLVLHEYRLIIELQPGQVVLFPSALITHCNIPLQEGDERFSIVFYSPGGLFRYVAYGCRTWKAFQVEEPEKAAAFKRLYVDHWNRRWENMARVPDLEKLWELRV